MKKAELKAQKIEVLGLAFTRLASNGVVTLDNFNSELELKNLWPGATYIGVLHFVRLNESAWGGYYCPSRKAYGNPRAFRDTDRATHWTYPKYILPKRSE